MSKRVGFSYLASCLLPFFALAVLMLRLFDPWTRYVAVGSYLVGCIALLFAVRLHGRVRTKLSQAKHHALSALDELGLLRKRAALAFVVFAGALLLFPVLLPMERGDFVFRSRVEISQEFERSQLQLRRTEHILSKSRDEFYRLSAQVDLRNPQSTHELKRAWAGYFDHAMLLDRLVFINKHFYQLALRSPELADRSFLIGYNALVLQMNAGHHIATAIGNRPPIKTLLNEADEELGLDQGTYLHFLRGLTHAESLVRLEAGYGYLKWLRKTGRLTNYAPEREHLYNLAGATLRLYGKNPSVLIDAPFERLEKRVYSTWFPMQRGAAQAISPVRTKHRDNFISGKDLKWARDKLRPGDILLQRRNWYLTNLGIPGFWPHAALYVGTPAELDAEFGDDTLIVTEGLSPSEYLQQKMPQVFAAMSQLDGEGRPPRVIEAVGEGVIVQPFEVSGAADYMAALSPRLSDEGRLRAVMNAFSHFGKPYDYNFEFATDESVVCSELVFKALARQGGFEGLSFPLTKQNGRYLLPPNDIARVFDIEYKQPEQQMDFVFFLDGNEEQARATFNDVDAFRGSWRRSKWDIVRP